MKCRKCSKLVQPNWKFCAYCGSRLGAAATRRRAAASRGGTKPHSKPKRRVDSRIAGSRVLVDDRGRCKHCGGDGLVGDRVCGKCSGIGRFRLGDQCDHCLGGGKVAGRSCRICGGAGTYLFGSAATTRAKAEGASKKTNTSRTKSQRALAKRLPRPPSVSIPRQGSANEFTDCQLCAGTGHIGTDRCERCEGLGERESPEARPLYLRRMFNAALARQLSINVIQALLKSEAIAGGYNETQLSALRALCKTTLSQPEAEEPKPGRVAY